MAGQQNWYAIGQQHYHNRQFEQAIGCFTKAIDELKSPKSLEDIEVVNRGMERTYSIHDMAMLQALFYNRGICFTEIEDFRLAIENLSIALRYRSTDTDTLNERAFAYLQINEYDKAIADLEQAVQLDPANQNLKKSLQYAIAGKEQAE